MTLGKVNNKIICLGIFILFLALSLVFTKAPLAHLNSMLPQGPDPLLVSWIWSWEMHQIPINPLTVFDANIFAPLKNTLAFTEHMFGSLLLAWPLFLIFKNIILVFNIISLSSFAIGGLGMYLLAFYLTKNKAAAFIAAFIYAFAPYKITHLEHINLSGMWLPYFFLYLHKIFERLSWKNVFLFLLFALLIFLSAMQYFLFLPLAFLLFIAVQPRTIFNHFYKGKLLKIITVVFVLFLVAIPVILPYLQVRQELDFERSISTIEGLSPDLYDYFISPFFYNHFYPTFFQEWVVGPGVFVLLLFIGSSFIIYRQKSSDKSKLVYYLIAILAVFFSFGYFIQFTRAEIGGLIGPWAFLYHFIPGFNGIRCVGRYSIFFLLSASVIIALGAKEFFVAKFRNSTKGVASVLCLIIILLFIEFSFVPSKKYIPVIGPPPVYTWLARQADDHIYLELPFGPSYMEDSHDALYEYFSIFHFKKLANGYSGYAPKEYEGLNGRLRNFDVTKDDIYAIKQYGATHVIFHFDYYPPNFKSKTISRLSEEGLADLIYFVDNDYVYQLK